MYRKIVCITFVFCTSLSTLFGQTGIDSVKTIEKTLDEVEVVQDRLDLGIEHYDNQLILSTQQIQYMPKFLGTSDPIRYMQSLPGVQTNNESSTGIHIQGCDDYQSLISINAAPVYYPNHLLGLYSTFIAPHFRSISIEQAEHAGTMGNRVGGKVDFQTQNLQPDSFSVEGNIGLISADASFAIPCGKKNALFISARSSYIDLLYGKLLRTKDYQLRYHFMDYNLTYASQLTDKDKLVFSGFYSRDKLRVSMEPTVDVPVIWQNGVGSAYWNHHFGKGNWRTTAYYSYFDNDMDVSAHDVRVKSKAMFSSVGLKNNLDYTLSDALDISAALNYEHFIVRPMQFNFRGIDLFEQSEESKHTDHAAELGAGVDLRHSVCTWFSYNAGVYASLYAHQGKVFWGLDPRVSMHFYPAPNHSISLHYGMYHQYFHKTGLTSGGLPTDFFVLANETFRPEVAHAVNLRYTASFLSNEYNLSGELYFKQIYSTLESTSNVLKLLNEPFSYDTYCANANGRNFGLNLMFQRSKGIVTGYVSYTLGWALRSIPSLEGRTDYIYAASHERRHDLKLVLNSHFCKRWHVGAMFVLATGLPYTKAEEAYVLNDQIFFRYGRYNGAQMPLYHRLDLTASCDIINKNGHYLGINLSLYNVYAHKNAQFVLYRSDMKPVYGTQLVTIIPSISIYGKF